MSLTIWCGHSAKARFVASSLHSAEARAYLGPCLRSKGDQSDQACVSAMRQKSTCILASGTSGWCQKQTFCRFPMLQCTAEGLDENCAFEPSCSDDNPTKACDTRLSNISRQ